MPIFKLTGTRTDADLKIAGELWKQLRAQGVRSDLDSDSRNVRVTVPFAGESSIQLALDALCAWDLKLIQHHHVPPIYDAGVKYTREILCTHNGKIGICEEWVTCDEIILRGGGDCEDLGSWLGAQYRSQGIQARPFPRRSSVGWHIQVRLPDGSIEDPSAVLGMPTA